MSILNGHERALLDAGIARRDAIEMLHRSGTADAKGLQRLVGQRCKKFETTYEIASVSYGWDGFIHARGYRILKGGSGRNGLVGGSGKRGRKIWSIGPITAKAFEDV